MRILSTYTHGVIDYLGSLFLIASPWIFGFAAGGPETWTPVGLGIAMMGAALFTDYELGVVRQIPMRAHLSTDVIFGIFLAISPWIFGFADRVWMPHVIFGVICILGAVITDPIPSTRRNHLIPRTS